MNAQPGIFVHGTVEHCYLELDLVDRQRPGELAAILAGLDAPGAPTAGVEVVVGFRPELWAELSPGTSPADARAFREIAGPEVTLPATQHDAWVWLAGGSRDAVFDSAVAVLSLLEGVATAASEITGWVYRHDRDLTGFIDGTENPSVLEAPAVALVADGAAAGSSVVLVQQWVHHRSWTSLPEPDQERVIGRTKSDSVELDDAVMPADSHVTRNVIEEDGEELAIYRRNTAYGGPTEHGTVFVGFCAQLRVLDRMLERMAGVGDGVRDALTRYTTALTGAYYVVPALNALRAFVPEPA